MAMKWTTKQQQVIDLREQNILVSAAAGSGKTAVLVERIIRRILDPHEPLNVDELLVVTFTKAAAQEMKDRVRTALEEALESDPANEHLQAQSVLIHSAQITTIDSFCLGVVQDHFPEIDLDPGFRTAEEGELKLLMKDTAAKVLAEKYETGAADFLAFVTAFGGTRDDEGIAGMILDLYEFSRSNPEPQEWLQACLEAYEADGPEQLEEQKFVKEIIKFTKAALNGLQTPLQQARKICREQGFDKEETYFQNLLTQLQAMDSLSTYRGLKIALDEFSFGTLRFTKIVDADRKQELKALRDAVKNYLDKDLKKALFFQSPAEMAADIRVTRPYVAVIIDLVRRFDECFRAAKQDKNILDFADMEHYALQILTTFADGARVPGPVAREYQEQFREIMIDEYQDSNFLQEAIFASISRASRGEYNLFMVGDVKQSIYRFRLARPDLFVEKYQTYSLTQGPRRRIDLNQNFRSRARVLTSVNYLFERIMYPEVGGIRYDENAALNPGAAYSPEFDLPVEVCLLDPQDAAELPADPPLSRQELEARYIAGRIRQLVGQQQLTEVKTGTTRPAAYSDIVILMRGIKNVGEVYTKVLTAAGIPTVVTSKEGYFSTREIQVLLDYLRILDNIRQDLPLAAVLVSPFGGLTEEDLARIRENGAAAADFAACLEQYREHGSDEELREKLKSFADALQVYRRRSQYLPIHELLHELVTTSGYLDFVSALPGGQQRRANVEMLIEKARSFDTTSYNGVFHFIRYIEQLKKYEMDYGEAGLHDENADAVRIMTIHKSKGLEFPIVFLANTGQKFMTRQFSNPYQMSVSLGLGLDFRDPEQGLKGSGLLRQTIAWQERQEALGEELRVLYVAMTRAQEKLIITGALKQIRETLPTYAADTRTPAARAPFFLLNHPANYLSLILPAVLNEDPANPFLLQLVTPAELLRDDLTAKAEQTLQLQDFLNWDSERVYDPVLRKSLAAQFAYRYPYQSAGQEKVKFTVSELKKLARSRREDEEESTFLYPDTAPEALVPAFIQGQTPLQGAGRGTAYHRVMELWDFKSAVADETEVAARLLALKESGRLDPAAYDVVAAADIYRFLQTAAAAGMQQAARAGRLYKEQPFVIGLPAAELYPDEDSADIVLVQGIIDAYYEAEGQLVVLDYKTDRVQQAEQLTSRYRDQLDYYQKALEQLTGRSVGAKIIYSFTLGEEITC